MPRRDRSNFSDEADFRSIQLLEELSLVVEGLKMGFSTSTPFSTIMRSMGDLFILLRDLLEEGIPTNPSAHILKIYEDRKDPLINLRDENMNIISKRIPVPNPIKGLDPRLAEWLENIIVTLFDLASNPDSDPNLYFRSEVLEGNKTKQVLNRKQYWYWKRKGRTRKISK